MKCCYSGAGGSLSPKYIGSKELFKGILKGSLVLHRLHLGIADYQVPLEGGFGLLA